MGLLAIVTSQASFASGSDNKVAQCDNAAMPKALFVKKTKQQNASLLNLIEFADSHCGTKASADDVAKDIEPNAIMMKKLPRTIIAKR